VVKAQQRKTTTGREGLVDMMGIAKSEIEKAGKVFVHGEYWDARSDRPIPKGSRVRVKSVDSMLLTVEKVD
jgi:membrane-bound serine protease (ClpP class)